MAENVEIKECENISNDVTEFAKEVYQQCVNKGWSIADFGLFVSLINIRKESTYNDIRRQLENAPLPIRHKAST